MMDLKVAQFHGKVAELRLKISQVAADMEEFKDMVSEKEIDAMNLSLGRMLALSPKSLICSSEEKNGHLALRHQSRAYMENSEWARKR